MSRILCLSIRQPWAWAILHSGKDIENRDWTIKVRGRILIHASKGCTRDEWADAEWSIRQARASMFLGAHVPEIQQLDRGGIVGSVEIVGCVDSSESPWFCGKYGLVLANPKLLPFVPCKGQLGFFDCPPDALKALRVWLKTGSLPVGGAA